MPILEEHEDYDAEEEMLLWQHWLGQLSNGHYKFLDCMIGRVELGTGEIVAEHMEYHLPLEEEGHWRWRLRRLNVVLQLLPG